ncbi:hypothetical protein UFOVP148_38 [uncultured Caudovirales phage]|uniref:Uncharacterized protein n=1 Tax=uncultured Caudovirales phage TaxID=2100421 RepID=A0A6J7W6B0_9CAUD|nr:hypothetical protein UFOVP148_38 [uncultured Caudovirales phage]
MTAFTKGQKVTQVLPAPVEGEVSGFALDQENGEVIVQVTSVDSEGVEHTRFFRQSEITAA